MSSLFHFQSSWKANIKGRNISMQLGRRINHIHILTQDPWGNWEYFMADHNSIQEKRGNTDAYLPPQLLDSIAHHQYLAAFANNQGKKIPGTRFSKHTQMIFDSSFDIFSSKYIPDSDSTPDASPERMRRGNPTQAPRGGHRGRGRNRIHHTPNPPRRGNSLGRGAFNITPPAYRDRSYSNNRRGKSLPLPRIRSPTNQDRGSHRSRTSRFGSYNQPSNQATITSSQPGFKPKQEWATRNTRPMRAYSQPKEKYRTHIWAAYKRHKQNLICNPMCHQNICTQDTGPCNWRCHTPHSQPAFARGILTTYQEAKVDRIFCQLAKPPAKGTRCYKCHSSKNTYVTPICYPCYLRETFPQQSPPDDTKCDYCNGKTPTRVVHKQCPYCPLTLTNKMVEACLPEEEPIAHPTKTNNPSQAPTEKTIPKEGIPMQPSLDSPQEEDYFTEDNTPPVFRPAAQEVKGKPTSQETISTILQELFGEPMEIEEPINKTATNTQKKKKKSKKNNKAKKNKKISFLDNLDNFDNNAPQTSSDLVDKPDDDVDAIVHPIDMEIDVAGSDAEVDELTSLSTALPAHPSPPPIHDSLLPVSVATQAPQEENDCVITHTCPLIQMKDVSPTVYLGPWNTTDEDIPSKSLKVILDVNFSQGDIPKQLTEINIRLLQQQYMEDNCNLHQFLRYACPGCNWDHMWKTLKQIREITGASVLWACKGCLSLYHLEKTCKFRQMHPFPPKFYYMPKKQRQESIAHHKD